MVAAAFGYFNYTYSKYKFINFKEWILYTQTSMFVPDDERLVVLIYSSHAMQNGGFEELRGKSKVLAIDLYQARRPSTANVIYATAGTNTLLKIIHRFHIRSVPSYFFIRRINKDGLYKQDSLIYKL